uniref:Uncharacterized protein n=1 Tax=Anopheles quadriannulatus TaxID=34691 RepID=A0A182XU11_ANOQN
RIEGGRTPDHRLGCLCVYVCVSVRVIVAKKTLRKESEATVLCWYLVVLMNGLLSNRLKSEFGALVCE